MTATWNFLPNNSPDQTFNVFVTLEDGSPTQYSAVLSKCKGCNPGPLTDFNSNKFSYSNVQPGTWYLNVKKSIGGIWSTVSYWTIVVPAWYAPSPSPTPTPTPVIPAGTTDSSSTSPLVGGFVALIVIGVILVGVIVSYKMTVWFVHYGREHNWNWGTIFWAVIIGGLILYYLLSNKSNTTNNNPPPVSSKYTCNCSKTCPNMTCDEAYYQLNVCGCSARDGDGDGIPCEAQCR